ncbi:MAG: hypothetical protein WC785_03110 [Tatlockia sp.]|jgi:hypothetical protein
MPNKALPSNASLLSRQGTFSQANKTNQTQKRVTSNSNAVQEIVSRPLSTLSQQTKKMLAVKLGVGSQDAIVKQNTLTEKLGAGSLAESVARGVTILDRALRKIADYQKTNSTVLEQEQSAKEEPTYSGPSMK